MDLPRTVGSPLRRFVLLAVAASAVFTGSGCGLCRFHRDWDRAACRFAHCPPGCGVAGLWEGTWESHVNGHHGKLKAIITPCGDHRYHAQFFATFAVVIPAAYEITLTAGDANGVQPFSGNADLGCLAGGIYTYSGQAGCCEFVSSYCAEKDHGIFRMRRVQPCCGD